MLENQRQYVESEAQNRNSKNVTKKTNGFKMF